MPKNIPGESKSLPDFSEESILKQLQEGGDEDYGYGLSSMAKKAKFLAHYALTGSQTQALKEISEKRKYRPTHSTIHEWCRDSKRNRTFTEIYNKIREQYEGLKDHYRILTDSTKEEYTVFIDQLNDLLHIVCRKFTGLVVDNIESKPTTSKEDRREINFWCSIMMKVTSVIKLSGVWSTNIKFNVDDVKKRLGDGWEVFIDKNLTNEEEGK